jgi:hypothetical protein
MPLDSMNGARVTRYKEVIFIALPAGEWRQIDGGCGCRYCSETDRKAGGPAYWDTLVVPVKAPRKGPDHAWTCHYPELHGAQPKRAEA